MRHRRVMATLALASALALLSGSPGLARRGHGGRRAADSTPANASAAVCRSRARDYAYEKHADPGGERLFFEHCMGR